MQGSHGDGRAQGSPIRFHCRCHLSVNERMPQAVVAVDDSGAFEGYFSPDDYRQAQSILS